MCEHIQTVYCKRCMDILCEECQTYCDSCGDAPLCFSCLITESGGEQMITRFLCYKCVVKEEVDGT